MNITRLVVGPLEENTYILEIDNELLIVDPGSEYDKISKAINNRKVLGILITHSHFDHIGALDSFKDIDIYKYDVLEEKEYNIGKFKFDVIFNPGHSKDSVSYYFKKYNTLFSGDFIFYESIGRCDLPTGSISDMEKSIDKIKKYDKDMIIYPGHGEDTTLSHEIEYNPYF
mgnify:FL=1